MKKDWIEVELEKVSQSIQYGYTASSTSEILGPKFLRITDIQDRKVNWNEVPYCEIDPEKVEKYQLTKGDILFARTGATVGKTFLIRGEIPTSVFASYLIKVRTEKAILNDLFLSYFFDSPDYWIQITENQSGIGQPNVNGTKLGKLIIPIPPLPEQRAIVDRIEELFSELDHAVSSLQAAQAKLDIYRQAVLKKAFEGGFTSNQSLNADLPENWKEEKLGNIAKWGSGGTPSRSNPGFYEGNIPWLKTGELGSKYVFDAEEKITEEAIKNSSAKVFPSGSVGIAMYGATIGKTSIFKADLATNQACAVARPNEFCNNEFLYYFFLSIYRKLVSLGQGGAQPNISQTVLKEIEIKLPPLHEQTQIVQEIESRLSVADKMAETIQTSLQKAEALRQSILKKAFEGRLLSGAEVEACRKESDWEPAEKLLERITSEKKKK